MRNLPLLLILVVGLAPLAHAQDRFVWTGGTGEWSDATRWAPAGVPAAADTAVIGPSGAMDASSVAISNDVTVAALIIQSGGNGAGIMGQGDVTITDLFRWMSNAGPGGMPTISGTGNVVVGPGGVLELAAPNWLSVEEGRTVILQGTGTWASGLWNGQGRLMNEGTLVLPEPVQYCFGSTPGQFVNAAGATLRYTASGSADLHCSFRNAGVVRIESGLLHVRGWGGVLDTDAGSYEVWEGARLRLGGADRVIAGSVAGGGRLEISEGWSVTLNGTLTVPRLRILTNGIFHVNSDAVLDVLAMDHATLGGMGTVTVSDSLRFLAPPGLRSTLMGAGELIVLPGAAFEMEGNAVLDAGRTLTMQNEWTWPGGHVFHNGSEDVILRNEGTALLAGEGDRVFFGGTFINEGAMLHLAGLTRFNAGFSTTGHVDILGGILQQQGFNTVGGTDAGRYSVASGARLEFTGGIRTIAASGEIVGTGTVVLGNGFQPLRGTVRPGQDDAAGVLTVEGTFPRPHADGVVEVRLGGPVAGQDFSQLAVTGQAYLGGALRVVLADGFAPAEGDRFRIVQGAIHHIENAFDGLDLPAGLSGYVEVVDGGADFVVGAPVSTDPVSPEPLVFAVSGPFPNPSGHAARLAIVHPEDGPLRIQVFDVLGRLVLERADPSASPGEHEVALDLRRLPGGSYVLRVTSRDETSVRRLTIAR